MVGDKKMLVPFLTRNNLQIYRDGILIYEISKQTAIKTAKKGLIKSLQSKVWYQSYLRLELLKCLGYNEKSITQKMRIKQKSPS